MKARPWSKLAGELLLQVAATKNSKLIEKKFFNCFANSSFVLVHLTDRPKTSQEANNHSELIEQLID